MAGPAARIKSRTLKPQALSQVARSSQLLWRQPLQHNLEPHFASMRPEGPSALRTDLELEARD